MAKMHWLKFSVTCIGGPVSPKLTICLHCSSDAIKLQLVEAGLVECLLEIVQQKVDSDKEDDIAELKTASDLMVLLLLGGEF